MTVSDPYLQVFLAGFLSATLLPGGSEFLVFHYAARNNFIFLVIFATIGNVAGSFFNYILGRWFSRLLNNKWIGQNHEKLRKAEFLFNKWGSGILFFSFLPIIGDPLTMVAGILKYSIPGFLVWVTAGKALRYLIIGYGGTFANFFI